MSNGGPASSAGHSSASGRLEGLGGQPVAAMETYTSGPPTLTTLTVRRLCSSAHERGALGGKIMGRPRGGGGEGHIADARAVSAGQVRELGLIRHEDRLVRGVMLSSIYS